jgi:hypothetical protein
MLPPPLPLTPGWELSARWFRERYFKARRGRDFPLGRAIAFELFCDNHPPDVRASFEPLAEERLRRGIVPPTLHKHVEDVAVLIQRAPEVIPSAMHREQHFIEVPLLSRCGAVVPHLMDIRLPKCPAPCTDRFIRHDDVTGEEELFHMMAITEAELALEPDTTADHLGQELVVLVAVES